MKSTAILFLFTSSLLLATTKEHGATEEKVAKVEDKLTASYRRIIEAKYDAPVVKFEVVEVSPTTKVFWYDWEEAWWGGMNVIETKPDGAPLFWYDFESMPTAQSIERVRTIAHDKNKLIEVIDCTHMGNGTLYLYAPRKGRLHKLLETRVITNLGPLSFHPRLAKINYVDLNNDGHLDVTIDATVSNTPDDDSIAPLTSLYHREFLFRNGSFVEDKKKRKDHEGLAD